VRLGSAYLILTYSGPILASTARGIGSFELLAGPLLGTEREGAIARALSLKRLGTAGPGYFFFGRLAGGMIPFIRRYSTIWP
jgi:hypothetical protein